MIVSPHSNPAIERQGLRIEEAAHALGCGRTTVFKLIREGRLRVVKLGARTIVPRAEIARLLAETADRPDDAA
jgi:excisionase family DNA binding protein